MIIEVNETNIGDAAKVYMESWKDSHQDICSAEFIEKHDFDYMLNFLNEKIKQKYDIFILVNIFAFKNTFFFVRFRLISCWNESPF